MMKKAALLLLICVSSGWLFANHWTPNDSDYEDNMTLTGIVQINGVEQQSTTLEVGAFCGEECRGSGYLTYFFPTQRYVIQLLIFGETGDQMTFKLYDSNSGQELNLASPDPVTFNANGYGTLSEPYVLNFTGTGNTPHWVPNESEYEDNMTLTGVIQINGVEQQSTTLEVGVFCGEECRGASMATYFFPTQRYVVQLLIFGETGDQLTFKLYDHALGQELDLISPDAVTFTTNGYGTLGNPYVLNFTGGQSETTQTIGLSQGWNWVSFNVEITLDDLKATLVAALPGTNSITIKSKNEGAATYNGTVWRGQLGSLDLSRMYRVYVEAACEITLEGLPINPAEHPITLSNGFNWIAFPFSESKTLTEAFAGFAINGDAVKSKGNGAANYNGTSWRGTLNTLVPGQGYIYKSNATEDRVFTFPTSAK